MQLEITKSSKMPKVIKRNGSEEPFSPRKLLKVLTAINAPNPGLVLEELQKSMGPTIRSEEISDIVQFIMLNKAPEDMRWHTAARDYLLWSVYKMVMGKVDKSRFVDSYRRGFRQWFETGMKQGLWNMEMASFYEPHIEELSKLLDPERDRLLTYNGVRTLMSRYLLKRLDGTFFETPQYMWMRVAMGVAYAESLYGGDPISWASKFYDLTSKLKFLPNSPTMFNAFTRSGELSACFVVPVDDCISGYSHEGCFGIYDALTLTAELHKMGAGTGYNFSKLRPEGDVVKSTVGVASGPVSFMRLFDVSTDVIKQGGKRRGAMMGILEVWHADIRKFIRAKSGQLKDIQLQNFNISVMTTDYFMKRALAGEDWLLFSPRECTCLASTWGDEFRRCYEDCERRAAKGEVKIWGKVNAKELFEEWVTSAWDSGDPGMLNKDSINVMHPAKNAGVIASTNPCGEVPLLPGESCNLGSMNITKYVSEGGIKWDDLFDDIAIAVRFLDDVIDVNKHPHKMFDEANHATRKIGLGINGLADMMIRLDIPYDSPEALHIADTLAMFMFSAAVKASHSISLEKGPYPKFNGSDWDKGILPIDRWFERAKQVSFKYLPEYLDVLNGNPDSSVAELVNSAGEVLRKRNASLDELRMIVRKGMRNATVMSIAPEGSRSLIAGVNSSIEPIFAIAYVRNLAIGKLVEYNGTALERLGRISSDVRQRILESGMLPSDHELHYLLKTANEIHWKWHVMMQATWQRWIDNGVSKTINMPSNAAVSDVEGAYLMAWELGAKGITVYRDKSKSVQVIYTGVAKKQAPSKITIKAINVEDKIEDRLSELGETSDPYCKTDSCG
ncbi:ribonucleoside-diphosphate reductase, adenosylcobalamin-dependent [Thermocladium modestius]|uniref:Vitamin B12-dependent ribonucleotide reductase n=1 Tax=Thermocladium modestius TaxID=62609 RepID=A0A830GWY5_9CREN|nr:adenosylcobalamin-dependent ribonucleoside-diphosphate reductase [Thermocladium modestius]GGP21781.1 ribonucleoside-diphosphate reductase, adenosylcobalamin-dependent [Thermocladium modestius]